MRAISWVLALLLCLCAPAEVAAQQSQIGLKLGVQPWTPLTNDSTVQFVLDDPSRVSDALNQTWQTYSDLLATAITTALGQPDLVADGVSFYDIALRLTQPLLTIDQLDGSGIPGSPYHVAIEFRLENERVAVTATTPTVCDSGCDPRCLAEFDATVKLDLFIQNTVGEAFSSPQTQPGSAPTVQITRFDFEGGNVICDLAVDLTYVLRLKAAIINLVTDENGPVNKPLASAGRNLATSMIGTLNGVVASYQRPEINLVILRAWLVDQAGGGKTIVLNLAPRSPLPDPSAGQGGLGGVITVVGAQGIKVGASGQVDCSQLPVTVDRITGPRPMTSPYGTLGEWPLEALDVRTDCDRHVLQPGQQANYRISRMSALFPQIVTFGSVAGKCTAYEASVRQGIDVKTPWVQGVLLPQSLYSRHDLTANYTSLACGGQVAAYADPKDRFLKYLIDMAGIRADPVTTEITKQYMISQGLSEALLPTLLPKVAVQVPQRQTVQSATPPAPPPAPAPPAAPDCTSNRYTDDPGRANVLRSVNVRGGDTTNCKIIGQLSAGSRVDVLSCTLADGAPSSWCKIDFGTRRPSFVSKRFLAFGSEGSANRGTEAPPEDDSLQLQFPATQDDGGDLPDSAPPNTLPDPQSDVPPDTQNGKPTDGIDPCLLTRLHRYCDTPQ